MIKLSGWLLAASQAAELLYVRWRIPSNCLFVESPAIMATEKQCIDCGAKFSCGPDGDKQCWCYYRPHVLPYYAADGDCVCPACFDRRAAKAEKEKEKSVHPPR